MSKQNGFTIQQFNVGVACVRALAPLVNICRKAELQNFQGIFVHPFTSIETPLAVPSTYIVLEAIEVSFLLEIICESQDSAKELANAHCRSIPFVERLIKLWTNILIARLHENVGYSALITPTPHESAISGYSVSLYHSALYRDIKPEITLHLGMER